ncbi:MAG: thiamine pyrophosphate-binding protein [Gemmatimonadales bacterium]
MTTRTGAALVVRALEDEGIRLAFGIPGTHNIELYDALAESETIRTVLITDEQSGGFMADAAWRVNGELACLNIVPGAGLTHAMSGIAEAYLDGMALLVLGCGIRRDESARAYQLHDVDQLAMVAPVCKGTFRPLTGEEIYPAIRQAAALARAGTPGPVMVEIPVNLFLTTHHAGSLETVPAPAAPLPEPADLDRAVTLLTAAGARPLLYLGWGAAGAGDDLVRLAETLGAPVATTITGKGVFPESHPLFLWNGFGAAAPPFVRRVADDRTVTLAIGCRFSEVGTGSYSCRPPGALIHSDINPEVFDRVEPAAVRLPGDARLVVRALLESMSGRADRPDPEATEAIATGRQRLAEGRTGRPNPDRVTPHRLFAALAHRLGPDTVYSTDSGNGTFLAMESLLLDRPGRLIAPVDYSCMGYSVPAAIGAKLARPDLPVVALPGDGAFLMTGLELLTAANQGAAVAVFVLRDRELAQIAQFQRTAMGRTPASRLPDYDVASLAEAVGIEWLRLDRDDDIEQAVEFAAQVTGAGRPVLIDTAIDYSEPTWFTKGVVRANLGRLPLKDRLRMIGRAVTRRLTS